MAVSNGLVTSFTFDGSDISEDILTIGLQTPNGMIDVSTLDLAGFQRIVGRRDTTIALTGRLSDASPSFHSKLSPATSTTVSGACVIVIAGKTFTVGVICQNYDVAIGGDISWVASATLVMNTGVAGVWS